MYYGWDCVGVIVTKVCLQRGFKTQNTQKRLLKVFSLFHLKRRRKASVLCLVDFICFDFGIKFGIMASRKVVSIEDIKDQIELVGYVGLCMIRRKWLDFSSKKELFIKFSRSLYFSLFNYKQYYWR